MAQIFSSLCSEQSAQIDCCYVNSTSQIQIVRIANIPNWYFERVVLPGQHLLFAALPKAQLEIHTYEMASAILADKIDCNSLRVNQDLSFSFNTTHKYTQSSLSFPTPL
ncbi:hypothetical protein BZZ01_03460 [Nostocales cyanobacterium HT-58-2]|nr:hypothetical protein BZZ01_03460 [Nostocales cyanobacterium HT-58-2]